MVAEVNRRGGLRSGEVRREQAKSVRERLKEKVEANVELVWQAYHDGLTATTPDGTPDYRARFNAADAVLNQTHGKPAQSLVIDEAPRTIVFRTAFAPPDAGEAAGIARTISNGGPFEL